MTGALSNKVCLIAGTTGIAAASARLFGAQGARIVAVGRSTANAEKLGDELREAGVENRVITHDLAEPGAPDAVFATAAEAFGEVDILFHVAGISGRRFGDGPLAECTDEGWDAVMAVNLRSMMQLNRACIRHWIAMNRRGTILNMASVLGFSYVARSFDTVAYAAAKGAIIALSQHAAATYAAHGIRINVIAPGLVETPMAARATKDPEILELLKRKQPLTAMPLTPEDCAHAALYLCGDAARGVTGIVLPVDAGWCVCG